VAKKIEGEERRQKIEDYVTNLNDVDGFVDSAYRIVVKLKEELDLDTNVAEVRQVM
jgi:hypothetical protein